MRTTRFLIAALMAATALTAAPTAHAFPPIHVRVPRIELPASATEPLTRTEWETGTGLYERRLAALGGDEEALGVQETLAQIRKQQILDELDACLSAAAAGVIKGAYQSYVDSGEFPDVTSVVASAIENCLDHRIPGYVPSEAREFVSNKLAEQVVNGVSGTDESSSQPVTVGIDWSEISSQPVSGTSSDDYTNTSYTSDDDSDSDPNPLLPIIAIAGGLGLLALIVRGLRALSR